MLIKNVGRITVLLLPLGLALPVAASNPAHLQQLLDTNRCPGCDLRDAQLEGVSLRGADLSEANLQGANLRNADLRYANFRSANLSEAVLIAADLEAANFSQANLREVDIRGANLKDAVLTGANTCGWQRQDARLQGVNLQEAGCIRPTPAPAPTPAPETGVLPQGQAAALLGDWLTAKANIFAPPFDRALLGNLTTGILYADSLNSVTWLENNNAFYQYGVQRVESIERFVTEGNRATLEARVTEDYTLYENGRANQNRAGFGTNLIRYNLQRVNGQWKIADYQVIN
ncbi:IMS domain-containing protein [Oscillatoria acuminata]|uniref:Putative low-complexity protein n=1 Tax=Oscillatoria acuminata PCC 6304 TaxID=56110 RepID=K9TBX2_9CYAN|nr:IMS domain-containing protein [Oscillatoria acuminata]AFY80040.1 putative low-complexity protein [Oscillatoria acuminata PCC 6304]